MAYNFIIKKDRKYFKSGICTGKWKKFFEQFQKMGLIAENIYIEFIDTNKPTSNEQNE